MIAGAFDMIAVATILAVGLFLVVVAYAFGVES